MTSSNQFYKRGLLQPLLINIPLSFQQTLATALLISATFLPNFSLSFCGGGEGRIWGGGGREFAPGDCGTAERLHRLCFWKGGQGVSLSRLDCKG